MGEEVYVSMQGGVKSPPMTTCSWLALQKGACLPIDRSPLLAPDLQLF